MVLNTYDGERGILLATHQKNAQIEEQVNFEREAIKQGLERLRKNTS